MIHKQLEGECKVMSIKLIYNTLESHLNKGYVLCPDASFLMNAHDVFSKVGKNLYTYPNKQLMS